jgi:adenosylmethionine-8-amino-7-oxononanoate aminotransferase
VVRRRPRRSRARHHGPEQGTRQRRRPIAATAIAAPVADALETGIRYGHTTSGHALACAAALATIEVLDAEKLPRNAQVRGNQLLTRLAPLTEDPAVTDVRGLGLATGIELASPTHAPRVADLCRHGGALVRVQGSTVVSASPLTISTSEADHLADIVTSAVETAARDAPHQEPVS